MIELNIWAKLATTKGKKKVTCTKSETSKAMQLESSWKYAENSNIVSLLIICCRCENLQPIHFLWNSSHIHREKQCVLRYLIFIWGTSLYSINYYSKTLHARTGNNNACMNIDDCTAGKIFFVSCHQITVIDGHLNRAAFSFVSFEYWSHNQYTTTMP